MKKKLLISLFLLLLYSSYAQVGIGTTDPKAALDIFSTNNEGLLIPRVALLSTTSLVINSSGATIATPTASELVYNTNTSMDVTPGYYYLSDPAGPWVRLGTGSGGETTPSPAWERSGNTGIDPATNFLGTTDSNPLIIKTSGTEQMRVMSDGKIGIGTNMPDEKLSVNGNASVSGTVETNGGFKLYSPPAGSNLKRADIVMNTNSVDFRMLNDNSSVGSVYMSAIRAGGNVSSVTFPNSAVGIGTFTPAAKLDITSTNEGILIPRVTLQSTTSLSPLTPVTATASELVYNTFTSPAGSANPVTPGYYYLSTATGPWVRLLTGADAATEWKLTGNAGTTATNFLGTTDDSPLVIKTGTTPTGNTERIRITATGDVGIGTAAPAAKLHVFGNITASGAGYAGNINMLNTGKTGAALSTRYTLFNMASGDAGGTGQNGFHIYSYNNANFKSIPFTILDNDNVGIGTSSPAAKLSVVNGTQIAGTAFSTIFRTSAGTLPSAIDSELNLGSMAGLSPNNSGLTASLYRAVAGGDWQNTALLLSYDVDNSKRAAGFLSMFRSNIGIGEAAPDYKLTIKGGLPAFIAGMRPLGGLSFGVPATPLVGQIGWIRRADQTPVFLMQAVEDGVAWRDVSLVRDSGNVGIGTDTPAHRLTVNGNLGLVGPLSTINNITPPNGAIRLTPNLHLNSGAGSANYINWDNGAGAATNPTFVVANGAGGELMRVNYNSNVGIGTSNPTQKLHVAGSMLADTYVYTQYLNTTQPTESLSTYPAKDFPIHATDNFIRMYSAAEMRSALGITMPTGDHLGNHTATQALNLVGQAVTSNAGTVIDGGGGWHRTYGDTGWFNGTWGGGMHMTDATWVRTYNGKSFYSSGNIGSAGSVSAINGVFPQNGAIRLTPNLHLNAAAGFGMYVNWDSGAAASTNNAFVVGNGIGGTAAIITYGGNFTATGTINSTGYRETSDRRWKKDIIPIANPLAKIMALKGVGYSFKTKQELSSQGLDSTYNFTATPQIGFIAQDVESVLPEVVGRDVKGYKTVEYSKVVVLLTEGMKEQQKQIEEQQKQIEALKKQNLVLKASSDKVDAMEARLGQLEQLLGQANGTRASNQH